MRPYLKGIAFFVVLAFFSGCGYHIAGKGGEMPGGITSVSIPVFTNKTLKPDIESIITSAFASEFVTAVRVEDDSPSRMEGTIMSYDLTAVSFTKSDVNQEYRLTVTISLKIYDADGKVIWSDDGISDYEDFTVNTNDVSATRDREAAALRKLSRDTARLVKERMLEKF